MKFNTDKMRQLTTYLGTLSDAEVTISALVGVNASKGKKQGNFVFWAANLESEETLDEYVVGTSEQTEEFENEITVLAADWLEMSVADLEDLQYEVDDDSSTRKGVIRYLEGATKEEEANQEDPDDGEEANQEDPDDGEAPPEYDRDRMRQLIAFIDHNLKEDELVFDRFVGDGAHDGDLQGDPFFWAAYMQDPTAVDGYVSKGVDHTRSHIHDMEALAAAYLHTDTAVIVELSQPDGLLDRAYKLTRTEIMEYMRGLVEPEPAPTVTVTLDLETARSILITVIGEQAAAGMPKISLSWSEGDVPSPGETEWDLVAVDYEGEKKW